MSYANRLQATPGIEAVTWANWFGGQYGDGKKFFAQFAIDPKSYLDMYPEFSIPEDQKQAFIQERSAALIGEGLVNSFGWKLGQNVTLQGTIFPGDWTFTIRGVYTRPIPAIGDDMIHVPLRLSRGAHGQAGAGRLVHHRDRRPGSRGDDREDDRRPVPQFIIPDEDRHRAGVQRQLCHHVGQRELLMGTIGMAVVFAILLVTANAMMMSERERTREVAVLKTIGFSDRTLFGLVMLEAAVIAVTGAVLGLGAAKVLSKSHGLQRRRLSARLRRHRRHAVVRLGGRAGAHDRERRRPRDARGAAAGRPGAEAGRMKIPFIYNVRSVLQRPASTAFTALGIGLVVAVFVGMLALANGFRAALARTGSDNNALILRRGADSELSSGIDRETATLQQDELEPVEDKNMAYRLPIPMASPAGCRPRPACRLPTEHEHLLGGRWSGPA